MTAPLYDQADFSRQSNRRNKGINAEGKAMELRYNAVIFDMDGTVLDTGGDLTDSLNWALAQTGHNSCYTKAMVTTFFGSGVAVAVTRALACEMGVGPDRLLEIGLEGDTITPKVKEHFGEEEIDRLYQVFKSYYPSHCAIKTGPYPGIPDLIRDLKDAGVKTAVVSNKFDEAVGKLAADYFKGLFDVAIGEKPSVRRKPAPDMTDKALKELGVDRSHAVYVGDSEIDLLTARNAGTDCISVDWGFRPRKFLEKKAREFMQTGGGLTIRLVHEPAEIAELVGLAR